MRQLLNASYAYLTEGADKDALKEFDLTLEENPTKPRSRGHEQLMRLMKVPQGRK